MDYIRMIEEFQGNNGEKRIGCRLWNTEQCSIHNGGHCENCDVFCQILSQLHMYESLFAEMIKSEVK